MLALLSLLAPALAAHVDTVGAKRTVKVDLYSFGQAVHPYGSDWKPSLLESWSGVLECEVTRARTEVCTFRDGKLWFGIQPLGTDSMGFQQLDLTADLEFQWTKTGRLARYDVRGDREVFWAQSSNALLALFHKADMVFKPDSQRRIGGDLEQALLRSLASALEIDRQATSPEPEWVTNKPMWAGRRYSEGVTATAKYVWTQGPEADQRIPLSWKGTVSEATASGSTGGFSTSTEVIGEATWDPAAGRVDRLHTEAMTVSSSVALVGHTRWIARSHSWKEGDSTDPEPMPEPRLNPR